MASFSDFNSWEAAARGFRQYFEEQTEKLAKARDINLTRGRTIANLVCQCEELEKENKRLVAQCVSNGLHITLSEAEIKRLQKGIEYFGGELDRKEAVITEQRGQESEIERLRNVLESYKIDLEGQHGAYLMAIDEITKLRQLFGQKLVVKAEELFEKTRDGTIDPTPASGSQGT